MATPVTVPIGEMINGAEKALAIMKQIETLHPDTKVSLQQSYAGTEVLYDETEDKYYYNIDVNWSIKSSDDLLR